MSREVVTSLNDHEYLSLKNSVLMTNFLVKKLVSPSFFFNKEIIQGYGNLHIEKEIDQKYVKNIYVNELKNLTNYLNKINNINKDVKYWEILIGTWLYRFINFLYNRYQTINKIIRDKKEKIVFRVTSNQNYNFLASENTEEFYSNLIDNCWNDTCFKKILIEQFKNLKIKEIKFLYESKKNIEIKIELKQKLKFFIFDRFFFLYL